MTIPSGCTPCGEYEEDPYGGSVETLLGRLSVAIRTRRLLLVDVAWEGCSGCANPALGKALRSNRVRFSCLQAKVAWKRGDAHTRAFTLFTEMVRSHRQYFGEDTTVESYPTPPWDRPHSPQLFFIDPRKLDVPSFCELCRFYEAGLLFKKNAMLAFDNPDVRSAVYRTFQDRAVLIQLLNRHLFAIPNDQFQEPEFFATFDDIFDQFRNQFSHPESCFRYERPGAGSSATKETD